MDNTKENGHLVPVILLLITDPSDFFFNEGKLPIQMYQYVTFHKQNIFNLIFPAQLLSC